MEELNELTEFEKKVRNLAVKRAIQQATSEVIDRERETITKAARRLLPEIIEELRQQMSSEGNNTNEQLESKLEKTDVYK